MTAVTLARAKPRIDDPEELERVVRRLVEAFDPLAIYLFGSRARGDAGDESDYDLMLVLTDDNVRVRSRQAIWETARSDRIDVNPFVSREAAFAWRRHEVGTLEYEVQVDGIRLYPTSGADLRVRGTAGGQRSSMSAKVVGEWVEKVRRDLVMARKACEGDDAVPDQAAYHVQQAAEKLTKAALVALQKRPRKGHRIGEFAKRLPATFALRERFLALGRFTKFVWLHRYPEEEGAPSEPEPSAAQALAWITEIETLKVDFERWLAEPEAGS
jgi:HEPN domain-containing protein/predicted nucleotidyltransferase